MKKVSEERKAELLALLEEELGLIPPKVKPTTVKVVVEEAEVVRDAVVHVAPSDPNYPQSEGGVVRVQRPGFVTIRMDLWEEQQRQKREDRLRRREIDPFRMGHWDEPE
jgi:hypothetical protein